MGLTVGYARVSTEMQAFDKSLNDQVFRLKTSGCSIVYADIETRELDNRPQLDKLLALVESKNISKILVTRLDRVAASQILLDRIIKLCKKYDVKILSLDEGSDILTREGLLMAQIKVAVSGHEVSLTRERITKSKEVRKQQGKVLGMLPFGYKRSHLGYPELNTRPFLCTLADKKQWSVEDLARYTLATCFELGLKISSVVTHLNSKFGLLRFKHQFQNPILIFDGDSIPDYKRPRQVRSGCFGFTTKGLKLWLLNPVLRGHMSYSNIPNKKGEVKRTDFEKWNITYNTHLKDAIINEQQWLEIKERLLVTSEKRIGIRKPLTSLVICGNCGNKMSIDTKTVKGKTYRYFFCGEGQYRRCDKKLRTTYEKIEDFIITEFRKKADLFSSQVSEFQEVITEDSTELRNLKKQLKGIEDLLGISSNSVLEKTKHELEQQIITLEIEEKSKVKIDEDNKEVYYLGFQEREYWDSLSDIEKTAIYNKSIKYVVILSPNCFQMSWLF